MKYKGLLVLATIFMLIGPFLYLTQLPNYLLMKVEKPDIPEAEEDEYLEIIRENPKIVEDIFNFFQNLASRQLGLVTSFMLIPVVAITIFPYRKGELWAGVTLAITQLGFLFVNSSGFTGLGWPIENFYIWIIIPTITTMISLAIFFFAFFKELSINKAATD